MQIKRFQARDIKTAIQMVKTDLGPDAVILTTREIKDRSEGGPIVEVTAGGGYPAKDRPAAGQPKTPDNLSPEAQSTKADWGPAFKGLEGGLVEIKELLLDLTHRASLSERLRDQQIMVRLYRDLLAAELDPTIARALVEKAAEGNGSGSDPWKILEHFLIKQLKVSPVLPKEGRSGCRHLAIVGPSGSGKTTTLAKLAAYWTARHQKKVAIINLDTFRLGASEQVRTYARIMGLPVRVAQDRDELKQAIELFENVDLVLIDTSSRALLQAEALSELSGLLDIIPGLAVLLVLSATTKDRDLAVAIQRASSLPVDSLIVSKIDETDRYGNIINNLIKYKKPVSFLTNGQKVPDDLIPVTANRLADLITVSARGCSEKN
ncbi:MAG: flagellar biosynthesis protein FlhF [Deltaproteobacteria bacterium]|nr:flagellar biosynthesis protein FlhF [Deltaproteobacteria bacterium]